MPRLGHGESIPLVTLEAAGAVLAARDPRMRAAFARPVRDQLQSFDFMFSDLHQDAANFLPESPATVQALKNLGDSMGDPDPQTESENSRIPAIYTYFGQFLDHDITLESGVEAAITVDPLVPLSRDEIRDRIENLRTSNLDLDSVYRTGPGDEIVPYNGDRLVV